MKPAQRKALTNSLSVLRVQIYEAELTSLARQHGCRQSSLLTNASIHDKLRKLSEQGAKSIQNTFNTRLASFILNRRQVSRTEMRDWLDRQRDTKTAQVSQWVEGTTKADAHREFFRRNRNVLPSGGVAVLKPRTAKEEICQGWINRGAVPVDEAIRNPPPYHLNCPHSWDFSVKKIRLLQRPLLCRRLWLGK